MTRNVKIETEDQNIQAVCKIMSEYKRIPIVEKENLEGIITDKDIFKAIMNNQISIDNLPSNNALIGQGMEDAVK